MGVILMHPFLHELYGRYLLSTVNKVGDDEGSEHHRRQLSHIAMFNFWMECSELMQMTTLHSDKHVETRAHIIFDTYLGDSMSSDYIAKISEVPSHVLSLVQSQLEPPSFPRYTTHDNHSSLMVLNKTVFKY